MDFAFSDEQQMLRAAARDFFAERLPLDRVASLADGDAGWDPSSWAQVVAMGWVGLSVPDAAGGAGMSFLDEAVLFEEAGRALYAGPLFPTVALALPLLAAAEDRTLLGEVLDGTRTASVGFGSAGRSVRVPDGAIVDDVLVVTDEGDVRRVDVAADRSLVRPLSTMDRTRRYAEVDVSAATPFLAADRAASALRGSRLRGRAALACEAVGIAQRCLDIASEHATQRHQFGRPIGSYQGVSHKVADMYVALELARSLAYWAAWSVSTDDEQAPAACAAAKAAGADAAVRAAESAIQVMGGIGFTWDHPLHRLYKRAQWIASYDGFPREQRAELAAALLDS